MSLQYFIYSAEIITMFCNTAVDYLSVNLKYCIFIRPRLEQRFCITIVDCLPVTILFIGSWDNIAIPDTAISVTRLTHD